MTDVRANAHEKSIWYEIYDDHLQASYFVDSADMRLVPYDELTALSADVPDARKYIHVDTATQSRDGF